MDRLFLIDGHALIFKMYYAFLRRPMINSKGLDTSILYGFTKYLLELAEREKPTHLAVAFDPPGGTFRNKLYPEYKGTRPPTPQLVIDALDPLVEIVRAMDIPVLMIPGYEADDVIGSMAVRSAAEGMDVYMVTPDKDYGQLISDHIFQLKPGKGGGDDVLVDKQAICEKWHILDPVQIIDMLAICGDTSDNVPGVKGVGEVGAGKLVSKYGSLENIYAHLDMLADRQKAMFLEAKDHIDLSKLLVTIKTDIPLDVTAEDMRFDWQFHNEIADLFAKYEFQSLRRYIGNLQPTAEPQAEQKESFTFAKADKDELLKSAAREHRCAILVEAVRSGIFSPVRRVYVSVAGKTASGTAEDFRQILEDESIDKYGADLKLARNLLAHAGIELRGRYMDIALLHYLVNPEKSHATDVLALEYLGTDISASAETAQSLSLFEDAPPAEAPGREKECAAIIPIAEAILGEKAFPIDLYDRMEEPLSKVLSRMEIAGVKVDLGSLQAYTESLRMEIQEREARVRELASEPELNVSSPKQVGEVLFDKLKLDPKAKKSSRGQYPTDESTLLDIAWKHPIVDEILEFRAAKKLLSTYIEPFPQYISPVDGRVHTTFNQALTATGRLSSSGPNLQNIPIRTERGMQIRRAFIPGTEDGLILSADYSQIELRIMAHLSCDSHLVEAFREGLDVHTATAAKIFAKAPEEVTTNERRIAKTANFGIMYGISAFGLAERLRISRSEAKKIIEDYFASFPAIRSFINDTIEFCRGNGYVETLFGRRRYLPDIDARNQTLKALAERNAVNAPIQGTSADIIKLAMIRVDERLREEGLRTKMVLQIHDELLFDTLPEEVDRVKEIVVDTMENIVKLSVPLTVECNSGKSWLEAH